LLVNLGTNNDVTVAGVSTLAEQQTQTTHLAAIETAVELLDNAVSGTEFQVDVVAALPAGTNNIGDVDVASLPAGSQAGATVKTADYDTGVGTDTVPMQGIALPASGGAVAGGTVTDPVRIDPTGSTTQPVSGTVAVTGVATLAEQQTQTTHLAAIETAVELLDNAVAGTEFQVDVVTSALPAGAATLVEQQTQTTHLATIAGDTTAIETAVQIMDDWDESDRAKVNLIVGQAGVAGGAGATSALTQRVVQADGGGKTILSASGSAASSGDNTLVAAGTNRLKVIAFSLTTTSTTAMTCIFQSGAAGTALWRVIIQAPTGASAGANLSIALPGWLFATASATLLNLNLSSANAVNWSVTYYDEA
jgi:hypothetical protein